jgi:hypothetical protein
LLFALLIGSLTTLANLAIQVTVIVLILGQVRKHLIDSPKIAEIRRDITILCIILMGLFAGHLLQFSTWAILFMWLGEFADINTAFYHSAVNFAALGYGDIVMSEKWRVLGGLEAANGILMFGLTTSTFVAVMTRLFARRKSIQTMLP